MYRFFFQLFTFVLLCIYGTYGIRSIWLCMTISSCISMYLKRNRYEYYSIYFLSWLQIWRILIFSRVSFHRISNLICIGIFMIRLYYYCLLISRRNRFRSFSVQIYKCVCSSLFFFIEYSLITFWKHFLTSSFVFHDLLSLPRTSIILCIISNILVHLRSWLILSWSVNCFFILDKMTRSNTTILSWFYFVNLSISCLTSSTFLRSTD